MTLELIEQWHKVTYDREAGHGINPEDFPIYHLGVGYYRRPEPEFAGIVVCQKCGKTLHEHGWMDTGGEGYDVCPGDWIVGTKNHGYMPITVYALQLSAQAWCTPATEKFTMNSALAQEFARLLIHTILRTRHITAENDRLRKGE